MILVASNIYPGRKIEVEPNIINAKTQGEIDFAENLGEIKVTDFVEKHIPNIPLSKNTFKKLHKIWFGEIYLWAGSYRREPILVANHDAETLPWEEIEKEMDLFFEKFSKLLDNITKETLAQALLILHVQLAWIHPFKDGNGRLIRYFSNLIALQFSYELNWDLSNNRKTTQYQKAVRKAVNDDLKDLRRIIYSSLKQI